MSRLALVSLQSASPSPPESVVEEERPGGPGGSGKQRAEDKDLSGPYVSGRQAEDWGGTAARLLRAFQSPALAMTLTLQLSVEPLGEPFAQGTPVGPGPAPAALCL